jgi:hypothetical protein
VATKNPVKKALEKARLSKERGSLDDRGREVPDNTSLMDENNKFETLKEQIDRVMSERPIDVEPKKEV